MQGSLLKEEAAERERTPAWTDRVLWKSKPAAQQHYGNASEGPVRQLSYTSVNSMTLSDHRAVHALFCMKVCPMLTDFLPSRLLFQPSDAKAGKDKCLMPHLAICPILSSHSENEKLGILSDCLS